MKQKIKWNDEKKESSPKSSLKKKKEIRVIIEVKTKGKSQYI